MRTPCFFFFVLALVGTACGNGSGSVIASDDASAPGLPGLPPPVDCTAGPNFTGCACTPGADRPCYTGPLATRGVGTCKDGVQVCGKKGIDPANTYGDCLGEVLPTSTNACTQDAGPCPALPAHCQEGYTLDLKTCQCVQVVPGGNGAACGGFAGTTCSVGFYCDNFPGSDPCGGGDSAGTCTPQNTISCVPDGTPAVCGCDNKPYASACQAHSAGVAVRKTGGC